VMQATGSVCSRQQNSESQAQAARMRAWAWHDAALFLFCSASLLTFVIILLNVWNNSFLLKCESPLPKSMTLLGVAFHLYLATRPDLS
jgi:hypothetical protein